MRLLIRPFLFTALVVSTSGCGHKMFHATGALASMGGHLGTWTSTPQGCIRAHRKDAQSGTEIAVATLLWVDPEKRDASLANQHQYTAPDAPLRLDLYRTAAGPAAVLRTVKTEGARFDETVCKIFTFATREDLATVREGRPTLTGTLSMDCRVRESHITANVSFSRCEY